MRQYKENSENQMINQRSIIPMKLPTVVQQDYESFRKMVMPL